MDNRKKIMLISSTLGGGGAERFLSHLINNLDTKKFKPVLCLLKNEGNDYLKNLNVDIEINYLNITGRIRNSFLKILFHIWKQKPDICYTGLHDLNFLFAPFIFLYKTRTKFIVRETLILSKTKWGQGKLSKNVYKFLFPSYKFIVAQSDDMKEDMIRNYRIRNNKIVKINNPVDIEFINNRLKEPCDIIQFEKTKVNLLTIGRLTYQKGYDILFNRLSEQKNIEYHLHILGKGEEEKNLKELARNLKIERNITFHGFIDNPFKFMVNSDLLILSSRYEGFPNVLLESFVCGLPVLANDCKGGINELVLPKINGVIANFENPVSFKENFKNAINNNYDSDKIKELVKQKYDIYKIIPLFNILFDAIN